MKVKWPYLATFMHVCHTFWTRHTTDRSLRASPRDSQKNSNRWQPDHVAP